MLFSRPNVTFTYIFYKHRGIQKPNVITKTTPGGTIMNRLNEC